MKESFSYRVQGGLLLIGKRGNGHSRETVPDPSAPQGGTVGLFVSILVRYPEVASVTYRRESHSLKLAVLVKSLLPEARASALKDLLGKSIRAYAWLTGRDVRVLDVQVTARQGVSTVELQRDVDSLTQTELSMALTLVRQFFGEELVVDQIPHVEGEELAVQEELIEEMLEDLRDSRQQPNLIAFREEGRVLVFNQ